MHACIHPYHGGLFMYMYTLYTYICICIYIYVCVCLGSATYEMVACWGFDGADSRGSLKEQDGIKGWSCRGTQRCKPLVDGIVMCWRLAGVSSVCELWKIPHLLCSVRSALRIMEGRVVRRFTAESASALPSGSPLASKLYRLASPYPRNPFFIL